MKDSTVRFLAGLGAGLLAFAPLAALLTRLLAEIFT